jgi:hypothetical protein
MPIEIDYKKFHGEAVSRMRQTLGYYTKDDVKKQIDADQGVKWRMVAGAVRNTYRVELIPEKKKHYGTDFAF